MFVEQLLVACAQSLNNHGLAFTLLLTAIALFAEWLRLSKGVAPDRRHAWSHTWRINAALFLCALATSWALAPWLSPAFNTALGNQSGLLNVLDIPATSYPLYVLVGVLLLDLLMYFVHRVMHAVPLLWRFHQVHHADEHMNASTHFRQHPGQMLAVTLVQLPALWLLGIPAASWILYVAISTALQLWQHSTCAATARVERVFRGFAVTPAMHRVHHDARARFHNANYAAVFVWWDRLFGTYRALPSDLRLGLPLPRPTRQTASLTFLDCLALPFRSSKPQSGAFAKRRLQPRPQGKA